MDLTIYQVILGPVLTSKALKLNQDSKKLTLEVHPSATKSQIKDALRKVFNIEKVLKINVVSRQGKSKRMRGGTTQRIFRKRAIVTLADAQAVDALSQVNIAQQLTQKS